MPHSSNFSSYSPVLSIVKCGNVDDTKTQAVITKPMFDVHGIDLDLVHKMVYDSLVWCSLHGLVVGDKTVKRSGTVPGVGMVHASVALLPMSLPESYYKQACELAPIFNELVDRVV